MFLYFIPSDTLRAAKRADLTAAGLAHALTAVGEPDNVHLGRGPGDLAGVLALAQAGGGRPDVACVYQPNAQTWRKGPGGRYWVGMWNDGRRPVAASLQRDRQIAGETVKLRDGGEWTVPIARSVVRGSTLPKEIVLGEDGESWETAELPEFLSLCSAAERAFEMFHGGESDGSGNVVVELPYKESMGIVVEALAVNYRVAAVEVAMLRLFGDEEMEKVLRVLCDLNAYVAVLAARKKKEAPSENSGTGSGSADSSPGTSPPSAT